MASVAAAWVALATVAFAASAAGDPPPTRLPAAPRVVAMADWHGDLAAARRALLLAGAIDTEDRWIGGDLVVVQTGDILDRGDQERAILDLLARLREEAVAAGGAVHLLLGNHEVMNAAGDFRYVSEEGWAGFRDSTTAADPADSALAALPPAQQARAAALRPGGPYARRLATQPVALIIGRNLFVHGGVLPEHVAFGLERLNRESNAWLRGEGPRPDLLDRRDGPAWVRNYCQDPGPASCAALDSVLAALDCDRLFAGHTIQTGGITSYCDQRVWCLDTGAAAYYGGPVQVVEITADSVRVLQ